MTEMNRRKYLSLIGASGAGLVIGTACGKLAEQSSGQNPTPGPSPGASLATPAKTSPAICTNGFKNWPTSMLPEQTPPESCSSVTLIFDGLMGFFYDQGQSQVAFHPAGNMHKPAIYLFEKLRSVCDPSSCSPQTFPPLPNRLKYIDISVVGRANKVEYYKPGSPNTCLDRGNGNPSDFRWLIDLEEIYTPGNRRKNPFGLVLRIQDGTFYTRTLTDNVFQRVDSGHKLSQQAGTMMGRMPHIMAAAIKLEGAQKLRVEFKDKDNKPLPGPPDLVPSAPEKVLELSFLNRCPSCGVPKPCDDSDEKKRNHFHYMRDVLELPSGSVKYSIALAASLNEPLPVPPKCSVSALTERDNVDYCLPPQMSLTDEAPCAGAGYGGNGGCNCI